MAFRLCLVACALMVSLVGGPVFAAECPVSGREETLALLQRARGCAEKVRLLQKCSWATSQDVEFSQIVVAGCEKGFLAKLSAKRRDAYDSEKEKCRKKYAGKQGTMYVSFAAMCEAQTALRYARSP